MGFKVGGPPSFDNLSELVKADMNRELYEREREKWMDQLVAPSSSLCRESESEIETPTERSINQNNPGRSSQSTRTISTKKNSQKKKGRGPKAPPSKFSKFFHVAVFPKHNIL